MNWPAPSDQDQAQRAAAMLLRLRYGAKYMSAPDHKDEVARTHDAADEFIAELAEFLADDPKIQLRYSQFVERKQKENPDG